MPREELFYDKNNTIFIHVFKFTQNKRPDPEHLSIGHGNTNTNPEWESNQLLTTSESRLAISLAVVEHIRQSQ